ncbi:hypothetical protein ACFZAD_27525 [Streptomyces iakyrus]|uniref:hypothetical protein n=1 Tax=Streptomyces iakyrus TaxID=68219 RepID=UPI0036EF2BF0
MHGVGRQESDAFVTLAERADEPGRWNLYRDVMPFRSNAIEGDAPTDAEVSLWTGVGVKP